jgi:hypothetical protein
MDSDVSRELKMEVQDMIEECIGGEKQAKDGAGLVDDRDKEGTAQHRKSHFFPIELFRYIMTTVI